MFLSLLELICFALILWAIISQIIYPSWRGTPLFSFFRKEEVKLHKELSEVNQEIVEEKLKGDIKEARQFKDTVYQNNEKEKK